MTFKSTIWSATSITCTKIDRVVQGIHGPIGLRQNQNLFLRVEPRVVVIHFGFRLASSKMIGRCSIEGILELYQKHLEGRRRQRDLTSRQHGRGRRQERHSTIIGEETQDKAKNNSLVRSIRRVLF